REWLAGALVEPDGVVEGGFREAARREPREAAVVSRPPEGESPITVEPLPAKKRRLRRGPRHGLDGIPRDFAHMPDWNHGGATLRYPTPSRRTPSPAAAAPLSLQTPGTRNRGRRLLSGLVSRRQCGQDTQFPERPLQNRRPAYAGHPSPSP